MFRISFLRNAGILVGDIEAKLRSSACLQPIKSVQVKDVSSGCGSFYDIHVTSPAFNGKTLIEQHRMINTILSSEIKGLHGFTLSTSVD